MHFCIEFELESNPAGFIKRFEQNVRELSRLDLEKRLISADRPESRRLKNNLSQTRWSQAKPTSKQRKMRTRSRRTVRTNPSANKCLLDGRSVELVETEIKQQVQATTTHQKTFGSQGHIRKQRSCQNR